MASNKKTHPKYLFIVVPLDHNKELDFGARVMDTTDTDVSAGHLFEDEVAERRPAAIVRIDTSALKIIKKHNRTKHDDD